MTLTAANPVDRLVLHLTAFAPRPQHTVYQYRWVAEKFLEQAQAPPTQDDVLAYIAARKSQAYKQWNFFILRRLFQANGWAWPFPEGSAPKIGEQRQIQLSHATIRALVNSVNTDEEAYYLALATVYGFRRQELASCTQANISDGILKLPTVKGGALREHTIPDEIADYLSEAPSQPVTKEKVRQVLLGIAASAGEVLPSGAGWHAIRRSLISSLSLLVPEMPLVRFMGWKAGRASRTLYTYAHPDPADVDDIIFEKHPFLGFWEDRE